MILGIGEPLIGRFLVYDALRMRFRELRLPKDPDCAVCGSHPTITELREYGEYCEGSTARRSSEGAEAADPGLTPAALKARIDAGLAPVIVDVREPFEHAICRIPGSRLIPLGELPRRLSELNPGDDIVVHCKSGGRSAKAVALLREHGYDRAANLAGGILAWINDIDPSQRRY